MGNSSSSSGRHQDDTVDYGALIPQGVYTGPRDWNQPIVTQLIAARKMAPFYRPLEDYEEAWDDDQVLAARKEFSDPTGEHADSNPRSDHSSTPSSYYSSRSSNSKRPAAGKDFRAEAAIYRGAVECPICFLYYPPNINHSRCCGQAICTECFVQIKRADPTTTHIVSEPAACPYCVQDNFGIVYTPPLWRAGIGSDGSSPLTPAEVGRRVEQASIPTHKQRQRSYSADSPEVVTIDQIRPDWEAKLAAVRAAVARRANRRIIMRQVGDRLIPVGIGRIQQAEEGGEGGTGSGRRRRHHLQQNGEFAQIVNVQGQDLEEMMLMEAMRLSLIDHEEHQKKEAEEKRKKEAEARASGEGDGAGSSGAASSSQLPSPSRPLETISIQTPRSTSTSPTSDRTAPPFSALNAALLSSGTAAAFLNSTVETPSTSTPENTLAQGGSRRTSGISHEDQLTTGSPSLTPLSGLTGDHPRPPSASAISASSSSSSGGPNPSLAGHVSYGTLPSSPESAQTPLLAGTANANDARPTSEEVSPKVEAASPSFTRPQQSL